MGLSTMREIVFDITAFGGASLYVAVILFSAFFDVVLAMKLFIAMACSYVVVMGIRLVHFRRRPDNSQITHWYDRVTQSSFPSMHATRAASLFTLIALYLSNSLVAVLAGAIIMVTCWSRVWLQRHYVSDVIVGAILGAIISYGVHILL